MKIPLKQTFGFAVIVQFFADSEEWHLIGLTVTYYEAYVVCRERMAVDNTIVRVIKLDTLIESIVQVEI